MTLIERASGPSGAESSRAEPASSRWIAKSSESVNCRVIAARNEASRRKAGSGNGAEWNGRLFKQRREQYLHPVIGRIPLSRSGRDACEEKGQREGRPAGPGAGRAGVSQRLVRAENTTRPKHVYEIQPSEKPFPERPFRCKRRDKRSGESTSASAGKHGRKGHGKPFYPNTRQNRFESDAADFRFSCVSRVSCGRIGAWFISCGGSSRIRWKYIFLGILVF